MPPILMTSSPVTLKLFMLILVSRVMFQNVCFLMLTTESLSVVCLLFTGSEDDPWITRTRKKSPEINFAALKNELGWQLVMETMLNGWDDWWIFLGFGDLLSFCFYFCCFAWCEEVAWSIYFYTDFSRHYNHAWVLQDNCKLMRLEFQVKKKNQPLWHS